MNNRNIAPSRSVNYRPLRLVANQPAAENDAQGTDEPEQLAPISELPDHLLFDHVFTRLPVRNMIPAAAVSRRFNRLLADTELPPPTLLPSESKPWYFIDSTELENLPAFRNVDFSLRYDPVSDRWRRFVLTFEGAERNWIWNKISSADGLVCAPHMYNRHRVSLQVVDPYSMFRSRYLPQFQEHIISQSFHYRQGVEFSINIWMINPADCQYKIIVSRTRMAIGRALPEGVEFLVVFYIDSYDKVSNTWRTEFWVELPNDCIITGSSIICRNILYNIVHSKRLERLQADSQFFLHQYDLARNEIVLPQFIALPYSLSSSPSPALVNCNDDLVLVGFITRGERIHAIGIWRFNSRTQIRYKWRKLGEMPRNYLHILTPPNLFDKDVACTGGGNLIYFRNIGSTRLVLVDVSQMDNGRLRMEAWKEASPYPTIPTPPWPILRHHFCYEPRLFRGTNL